jgi:hypothetical protein
LNSDYVEIMQQSIGDAMMDEMGKDSVCSIDCHLIFGSCSKATATPYWIKWVRIIDLYLIMSRSCSQSICDAMMDEMGKDNVGSTD